MPELSAAATFLRCPTSAHRPHRRADRPTDRFRKLTLGATPPYIVHALP
jgi:hypothetical protein